MWNTTSSKPIPRSCLSFAFFASSQAKFFTGFSDITMCACKAHDAIGASVPVSVPERSPVSIIRQPTPAKVVRKNRPETMRFPACSCSSAGLSKPPPSASRPPHR